MKPVKFGVIGCGMAAEFHTLAFKRATDAKLEFTAAHDVNEKQLARFAKKRKLEPYSDLDSFLESDIDAVLLVVPHHLHAEITKRIAKSGKHVLCEKPMAVNLEQCDEMISATKKAGVKFMIAENHRFLPVHKAMKEAVEGGLIGDVFMGRTYEGAYCETSEFLDPSIWHFTYEKGGGGVVMDQGVHKFAFLNWLLGNVDAAQCWLGKAYDSPANKAEDNAIILLRYDSGAMVEVSVTSTSIHPLTNSTELHGTKGSMMEDHSWESPLKIFSSHENAMKKGEYYYPSVEHGPYPKYYTISAFYEDSHFAECIIEDKEPEFTPEEAREAVAVVLLSYLAAKRGTLVTMQEFKDRAKKEGTKNILEGVSEVIQDNYKKMNWK